MASGDSLNCLRCSTELQVVGTRQFHTSEDKVAHEVAEFMGYFGAKISFDLYVCPRCGHTEMFLSHVGKEYRT